MRKVHLSIIGALAMAVITAMRREDIVDVQSRDVSHPSHPAGMPDVTQQPVKPTNHTPHQGAKERARRMKQAEKRRIK